VSRFRDIVLLLLLPLGAARAEYDFWAVEQILNDSLRVFHGNVAVEVYQQDSLVFAFRAGDTSTLPHDSLTQWLTSAVQLTRAELGSVDTASVASFWPQQSPYYAHGLAPVRNSHAWITAINPETSEIEELAEVDASGSICWIDKKRGLRGFVLTDAADQPARARLTELKIVHAIRDVLDCQAPINDLTIRYVVDSGVQLRWTGHFAGIYKIYSSDNPERKFPEQWFFEGAIPAAGDISTMFVDSEMQQEQAYYRIQRVCGK